MESVEHVVKAARGHFTIWARWTRIVWNFVMDLITGTCELQRICDVDTKDFRGMMVKVRTSVALDSSLKGAQQDIFSFKPFDVTATLFRLGEIKKYAITKLCESNLRACFTRFREVNEVYTKAIALKDEAYDSKNEEHEALLEQLWSNLKPDVRRAGGRYTKEWGEIGFQGKDPMTDFRSMGLLALKQLVYYTEHYPVEAKRALVHSSHPTQWYPFAVTGINITSFVVDVMKERLVDSRFYDKECSLEQLHEFYCMVFSMFDAFWVESNPTDLMAFPTVFKMLQDTIRLELAERSYA
ncbi:unnamed protein product [Aphanomyces euteiches]|uniref:ELMO domain-containing protein n=1 Tax=Aphanomyces euteiches TaxID=100861 RepID=A0A6G0WZD9_9STRA|nr:hypothetical protein Ae201684_010042 [Aphanomyces euteiches]KAH9099289.1 hypothetical protein Ae201684P_018306 [Aphanomyces euteiches]KAH9145613.1 hypothetical protein AeRB84_010478 [Aphanomyces euteiches]